MSERYLIVERREDETDRPLVQVTGAREAEAVANALRALDHSVELVRLDPPGPLVGSGAHSHGTHVPGWGQR